MSLRINKNHGFGNNTACNNCTKIIKAMQRLVQTCHDIFSAFLQHHPNRSAGMWNGADGPEHSGVSGYSTNQRVRMSPTAHQPPAACSCSHQVQVTYARPHMVCWICSHLLKCSSEGIRFPPSIAFIKQALSGTATCTCMAVQTFLICGCRWFHFQHFREHLLS